jgi:hypothetical protein
MAFTNIIRNDIEPNMIGGLFILCMDHLKCFLVTWLSPKHLPLLYRLDRRTLPTIKSKADTPRFLITLDKGIGDTALVGLSAVEQIIQNDPAAYGKIDILCSPLQSQIFEYDPRINRVIQTDKNFSAGPHVKEWLSTTVPHRRLKPRRGRKPRTEVIPAGCETTGPL